jgi:hypothetical protein
VESILVRSVAAKAWGIAAHATISNEHASCRTQPSASFARHQSSCGRVAAAIIADLTRRFLHAVLTPTAAVNIQETKIK